jgi:drug/metabolite transporter (DMT)-like permease
MSLLEFLTLLALFLSSACYGTSSVLQARAARSVSNTIKSSPRLFLALLFKITYLASLGLSGLGFLVQIPALRYLPLFLVQAFQASNLVATAFVGIPLLGLRLHKRDWISIAGVVVGLSLLTICFSTIPHRTVPSAHIRIALLVWVIILASSSYAARQMSNTVSAPVMGIIAGLAFCTVGVAVRVMPNLFDLSLLRDPALYAMLGSGILGFMMYADGLRRGPVTSTTAALLIAQIAGSALLGGLVLGDRVKIGFSFLAVIGAVITLSAAVSLARFAQVSDERRTLSET